MKSLNSSLKNKAISTGLNTIIKKHGCTNLEAYRALKAESDKTGDKEFSMDLVKYYIANFQ